MNKITTYDELHAAVDANGGVLTMPMGELRNIHGVKRLGSNVREEIVYELGRSGLASYPAELPDRQHAQARIYKLGSSVAKIINAVLNYEDIQSDKLLRKTVKGNNTETLDKIRELLEAEK